MHRLTAAALAAAVWAAPGSALGQGAAPLTLEAALAEARAAATVILRTYDDAARGRVEDASRLVRDNPALEAHVGANTSSGQGATEIEFVQPLAWGRGARIDAARAGAERTAAESDDALRRIERETAAAFYRVLHADALAGVAAAAETVAVAVGRIAERRHAAGDVPLLDVQLAQAALLRARAEPRSAAAARHAARGELVAQIGREPGAALDVSGDLAARGHFDRIADASVGTTASPAAAAAAAGRADLRALDAGAREAEAAKRAAASARWPAFAPGVEYRHEGGEEAVLGIVEFTLPLFDRAQGARTEAAAREREQRARLALETRRAAVELETAATVYRERAGAADALGHDAMPLVDRNEAMSRRAYEAGQIPLGEWMWVRRELLGLRIDHFNRLLEAALAGVELAAAAGASQSPTADGGSR